jgi:hypothetical protein
MVEVSRDGRRVYFANSLYGTIDEQLYPDGVSEWMVKLYPGRMVALPSTPDSSSTGQRGTGRTRSDSTGATARPIPLATPDPRLAAPRL